MATVHGSVTSRPDPSSVVSSVDDTKMCKISVPVSPVSISASSEIPYSSTDSVSVPNISLLCAAAFQRAMHSEGAQCFSAFIRNPNEVSGCHATPASESDLEGVPKLYHHFSDVFSKEAPKLYLHIGSTI